MSRPLAPGIVFYRDCACGRRLTASSKVALDDIAARHEAACGPLVAKKVQQERAAAAQPGLFDSGDLASCGSRRGRA